MSDLVVTVPKWFWPQWIDEGDAVGEAESGEEWGFFMGGTKPDIKAGDRLYIVAHNRLRGYAPVTRLGFPSESIINGHGDKWSICRRGGAVAMTVPAIIKGFQGWRRRWWKYEDEIPFPNWKTEGVK